METEIVALLLGSIHPLFIGYITDVVRVTYGRVTKSQKTLITHTSLIVTAVLFVALAYSQNGISNFHDVFLAFFGFVLASQGSYDLFYKKFKRPNEA